MGKWYLQVAHSFLIGFLVGSSSNLLVTRTGIKSQTSSNSDQIGSVTSELCALEHGLNFQYTYYGISKISSPILINFYIYHQWDVGKAAFGADFVKTMVTMAAESSQCLINIIGKTKCPY